MVPFSRSGILAELILDPLCAHYEANVGKKKKRATGHPVQYAHAVSTICPPLLAFLRNMVLLVTLKLIILFAVQAGA